MDPITRIPGIGGGAFPVAQYAGAWAVKEGWLGADGTVYDQRAGLGTARTRQPKRGVTLTAASGEYGDAGVFDLSGWETFHFGGWFKTTNSAAQTFLFAIMHTSSDDLRISLSATGVPTVDLDDTTLNGPDSVQLSAGYNDGLWHYLDVVFDGSNLTVSTYDANGRLEESVTETGGSFDFDGADGTTRIGGRPTGGFYFDGQLYGFKFGQSATNLAAYWLFEDDSREIAADSSGNENHILWNNLPVVYEGQDVPGLRLGGEATQPKFSPSQNTLVDIGNVVTSGDMTISLSFYATDWDGTGGSDTLLSTDDTSRIFLNAAGQIGMRWSEANYTWSDLSFDLHEDTTIVLTRTDGIWSLVLNGVTSAQTKDDAGIDWTWTTIGSRSGTGQLFDGFIWNVNINDQAAYSGRGATPWADTIGSNDGTPAGSFYNLPRQLLLASSSASNTVGYSRYADQIDSIETIFSDTFDTAAQWPIVSPGWTISGGVATLAGDGSIQLLATSSGILESGKWYYIEYDVSVTGSGNIVLQNASNVAYSGFDTTGAAASASTSSGTTETKRLYFLADRSDLSFKRGSGTINVVIDNLVLKELPGPPFAIVPAVTPKLDAYNYPLTYTGPGPDDGYVQDHNAMTFDGTQYIEFDEVTINGSFEIEFLFKFGGGTNRTIFGQSSNSAMLLRVQDSTTFRFNINGSYYDFTVPDLTTEIKHYRFVRDATFNVSLYINGVFSEAGPIASSNVYYDLIGVRGGLTEFLTTGTVLALIKFTRSDGTVVADFPLSEGPGVGGSNAKVCEVVSGTLIDVTNGCSWTTRDVGRPNNLADGFSKAHNRFVSTESWSFAAGLWSRFNCNSEDNENGVLTLTPNTSGTLQRYLLQNVQTNGSGETWYHQFEVKADGYNWVQLTNSSGFDPANAYVNINAATGEIGEYSGFDPGEDVAVTELADGWFRIRVKSVSTLASAACRVILAILESDVSARIYAFTGDGVSGVLVRKGLSIRSTVPGEYYPNDSNTSQDVLDMLVPANPAQRGRDALGNKLANLPRIGFNGAESTWVTTRVPEALPANTTTPGDGVTDPYEFNGDPGDLVVGIDKPKQEASFSLES